MKRPLAAAIALAAALPGAAADPRIEDSLRRAGEYVAEYRQRLALVCATERLRQTLIERVRSSTSRSQRVLLSDVLWAPVDDALVVAFYRDVWSVDDVPVRERDDRLLKLFPKGATAIAREQAGELVVESARHNLGRIQRTINIPTFALAVLHPANQPRFSFHRKGEAKVAGRHAVELGYDEVRHPTLTQSKTWKDPELHGTLWIADDGAVLKTELHYRAAGVGIDVEYGLDPGVKLWVPRRMVESYVSGAEQFEGVATYSGYKRGDVEIGEIRYR